MVSLLLADQNPQQGAALLTDALSRLAILHGTDKYGFHDYTPHYHAMLGPLRDRPIRLLEIGIGGYSDPLRGGESLAMWRDYFPKGEITGLDIARKDLNLGPRVAIRQGSQVDADCLSRLVEERGPFDVILDDGSHQNAHVVESFRLLFPTLASGGVYIIEDVQTALFPKFGGSLELKAPNSLAMALERVAKLQAGQGGGMARIERFHNLIVIHKRVARQKRPLLTEDRHLAAAKAEGRKIVEAEAGDLVDLTALTALAASAGTDGILMLRGPWQDQALLRDIFVQIDHREMRVYHPKAPLHGLAGRIAGLSIYPEGVLLLLGENSYPSNFAFDARHPQVTAVLAEMGEVLTDKAATEKGLLAHLRLKNLPGAGKVGIAHLDRLQAMGCRDPLYRLQRAELLAERHQWRDLLRLCREAQSDGHSDPRLTAHLGLALRETGQGGEALQILRAAQGRVPDSLPIIAALAEVEFDHGDKSAARVLLAGAIDRFPPEEQPIRLRALIEMAQETGDAKTALTAAIRLQRLDPSAVSIRREPVSPPGD
ncbi:class I SAM-dependent methyltransferase [uncultured Paracoccus sp.]|uniref:class I SAM-dependent methyltransferase n=1 Tax=uncultured Paracoccus sp. TaxID=189685 RepID=UPI002638A411|nr:class I SAM-dependent methyltransferase [uncultured Paracoccus sp.]